MKRTVKNPVQREKVKLWRRLIFQLSHRLAENSFPSLENLEKDHCLRTNFHTQDLNSEMQHFPITGKFSETQVTSDEAKNEAKL